MKKIYLLLLLTCATIGSYAQVTGTKTIGVDYTNIAAAITALNTSGISGAVVINVPAGWTETAPTGGYVLGSSTLNSSTSATNTLIFQKSGSGANPLITAHVGTTTTNDGIFIIQGTDYVTINSIDLQESSTNVIDTTQMEWGYALVKRQSSSPFDGCNNVTIKNSVITLTKVNTKSVGIYSGNHIATDITSLTISSTADALSNCSFTGNTITNVNRAISLNGYTAATSPYTLYDQNNTVGGASANLGNTLTDFGGTSVTGLGVYAAGQNNIVVGNNTITSTTTPGTGGVYGVFFGQCNDANATVRNNTFQLTQGSSGLMYGIVNGTGAANSGVSGTAASFTVSNNTFQNFSFTASNSSTQNGLCLYNYAGTTAGWALGSLKITENTVQNFSLNATGTHYLFYNYYCNSNDVRFNNNKMQYIRRTGTSGNTFFWYNYYGNPTAGADSTVGNRISNCSTPGSMYAYYMYMTATTRNRVIQNDTVVNDTVATGTMYSYLYAFYSYYGNNITYNNNYISDLYCTPSNYGGFYDIYCWYGNSHTVTNNITRNVTLGYFMYGYYLYYPSGPMVMTNNRLENVQYPSGTTSTNYLMYNYSNANTITNHSNVIKDVNASTAQSIYTFYVSNGSTTNFYNDTIYNVSTTGGSLYNCYIGGGSAVNVYNNHFGRLANNGTSGSVYGTYILGGSVFALYNNLIDSITNGGTTTYGVYWSGPALMNCYKNKISYVMSNSTSGTAVGMYGTSGAQYIHHNLISDIRLPTSSSTTGTNLVGLWLGTSTTAGYNVSYNTVVLNGTTSGSSYSSSALYWSAASSGYPLTMKNNIFINTSQQAGTGYAAAMRWNSSSTTYYNSYGSNNNLFYAGTPGTYRVLLYAGSGYQTLANLKTFVAPSNGYSVTENTTFQSLVGIGTNFLRPSTTVATQIESNGTNISGLTTDHYGTIRAGNTGYSGAGVAPDLGAIEDNYTPNDVNPPVVSGSPLAFSCGTGDRTFSATITDVTGVPTTGGTIPRVYFKKGAGGTWFSNPGTLASGTGTSGTWNFTITSSTMGGLTLGDVVYYFVIAQDLAGTPNVGSNPGGVVASSVTSISTYPTGLTYSVANSLSGTITVGSGGTYSTLTSAAAAYNSSCLSGPVTFSLISSTYPSETFPIVFNPNVYASSTNTLTIKPAAGVDATITGSTASYGLIRFAGADYITIDGSNTTGGTTKNLTINNTYTSTSACVQNSALGGPGNGADFNTVKNCTIIGGTRTSNAVGIFSGGTTVLSTGDDNKNFTVENNNIKFTYYGVAIYGTPAFPSTNTLIKKDSIGSNVSSEQPWNYGIYMNYNSNGSIEDNTIFNMKSNSTVQICGIYVGQNVTGLQIVRNNFTGLWNTYGSSVGVYGIDFLSSGCNNILVANNFMSDFVSGGYGIYYYYNAFGIRLLTTVSNLKIYDNTIRFNGNVTNSGSSMSSACIVQYATLPNLDMRGNILSNTMTTSLTSSIAFSYWMYSTGYALPATMDYNNYAGSSSTNVTYNVAAIGTAPTYPTVASWAAISGQDSHSISHNPTFVGTNDNHLQAVYANAPLVSNIPLTGVTTDYDGTTRSTTTPVMGGHEVNIPPTVFADSPSLTFGPTTTSTYSPAQTFTITGGFLTPAGTLTLTASAAANYQISPNGTTWYTSYTVPYTGTSVSSVVYVRFYPTAVGSFTGNVAITGGGLASATNVPLNGTGANACTGTPTPGTAAISPTVGGPTTPFTLNLTGTTVTGGLLYQWQASATGASGSFTNITGATTSTYNFTGISGNTFYQAVVTCPSYAAATSNTVAATFSMSVTYTGTIGTYVVPTGVNAVRIIARGAQGGGMTSSYPLSGGQGAMMQGDFCVTPGQVLKYIVGQMPAPVMYNAGGGGGSFVWDSATGNPLIVAGGGGGSAYSYPSPNGQGANASITTSGTEGGGGLGAGGYGVGGYGATNPSTAAPVTYYAAGGGGWYSAGNNCNYTSCTNIATGGSTPLSGGAGGNFGGSLATYQSPGGFGGGGGGMGCTTAYGGGGGGGGYSGGAAGVFNSVSFYHYGGGGGGSYNTGLNQVNSVGNTGNGTIVFTTPANATGTASATSLTFPVTTTGSTSPAMSYTMTASGIVTSTPLTLAATAGFEVSFDGSTWCTSSTPCTLTVTSSCITIPIYVRSTPTAVGAYTGTATITGGNLGTPVTVNLNGYGANVCSGTPTAGTVNVTPTSGNATTSFTLTLSGYTMAGGLSFQWQSAPSATGAWTNVSGGTNTTYTFSGLTATTYYRVKVTCSASSSTDSTAAVPVYYFPNPGCTPTFGSASASCASYNMYTRISYLAGYGGSLLSDATPCNGTGWENLTTTTGLDTLRLQEGTSYTASIQTGPTYNNSAQVWIDFNSNGSFESSETVGGIAMYINTQTATLSVPFGVPAGVYRMRIVGNYHPGSVVTYEGIYPAILPCPTTTITYGDCRDYKVTIVPLPICSGTPTPGTVSGTSTLGCEPLVSSLTVSGASNTFSGFTYQWQSSPDNTTWTSVSGATSLAFSPTSTATVYYRRGMTCTPSASTAYSTSTMVTVNPLAVITGTPAICQGYTTTLTPSITGGTWTSGATGTATIGASSGILASGATAGIAPISYTLPTGCRTILNATVTAAPAAITFAPTTSATVCLNGSSAFTASSSAPPVTIVDQNWNSGMSSIGGTWTITNVSGVSNSYWQIRTSPAYASHMGDGTPMMQAAADATTSNTTTILYSPSFSTVGFTSASLSANEHYTPYGADVQASIDYSLNGGTTWTNIVSRMGTSYGSTSWSASTPNTNITLPAACVGQPNVKIRWYYNSTYGFYWDLDNIKIKGTPVPDFTWTGPGTGEFACNPCQTNTITPSATGSNVYTVSATANGCTTVANVTMSVNPLPAAITGAPVVCEGWPTTLATTATGGTWQSSSPTTGAISTSGVVSGIAAGTTNVSYTFTSTGCRTTQIVTVNATPAPITGTASACVGASTSLSETTPDGVWTSGTPSVATITSSGVTTGLLAGVSNITYTVANGCFNSRQVTVNPVPVINVTPASAPTICEGESANFSVTSPALEFSLLNQDFEAGMGLWTVNTVIAPDSVSKWNIVNTSTSGLISIGFMYSGDGEGSKWMEAAPFAGTGASNMQSYVVSPSFSTVGFGSAMLTFNEFLYSLSSADLNVEVQYSTNGGSTWTTILDQMDVVMPSDPWTASTPDVSLALPSGALGQADVKLRWHYYTNYGVGWAIDNIAVKAALPAATFTWTGVSGATGLSCTSCATPTITPTTSGANVYNVTANSTCSSNANVTVNVNPLPGATTGASAALCVGNTINLTNPTAGGAWSTSDASVASVDPATGEVTGVAAGSALISYMLPSTCARVVTVNVGAAPSPIAGTLHVCEGGLTTTLSHAVSGGTWSSSDATLATINATSGVATGINAGNAAITYVLPTGCKISANLSVDPTPAVFTGSSVVCEASTTTLASTSTGGTWTSSSAANATVDASSGVVSGVANGTSTIVYTLSTGCQRSTVATVNVSPAAISGTTTVCEGATTALNSTTAGGAWSTSAAATADVTTAGVVSGIDDGNAVITYTMGNGCYRTADILVNPIPDAFTGTPVVCEGATTTLNSTPGGTWSGSTSIASVDAGTGVVTGILSGISSVTYTLSTGCKRSDNVTVNGSPAAITGSSAVCESATTVLNDATAGGTWSSSTPASATVDASGVVSGLTAGGATIIDYIMPNGCKASLPMTVNALPAAITGIPAVCQGETTALGNATSGGTWTSSTPGIGAVDASTGVVSGIFAGTTNVAYTLSTGCYRSVDVSVNALPAPISGIKEVCEGLTTNLSNTTPGGLWGIDPTTVATISSTGSVNGNNAGMTNVTYTLPTGCKVTDAVIVNPLPANITGTPVVCEGATTLFSNATSGGSWSSGSTTIANVNTAGVVTGVSSGIASITYSLLTTGCMRELPVIVNVTPAAITGADAVCEGSVEMQTSATGGGVWASSAPAVGSVDATGAVAGNTAGTILLSYTMPGTLCMTTKPIVVNSLPAAITGSMVVCEGLTTMLSDATPGGSWSSLTTGTSVDAAGVVTGGPAGSATIAYTMSTGCASTANILINATPDPITGTAAVCEGATTALTTTATGGAWTSGAPVNATVDATGNVNGIANGVAPISYTVGTGCAAVRMVTVNALPDVITGVPAVCEGLTTNLANAVTGGSWISSALAVGTVDATTGVVTGVASGSTIVTYMLGSGCMTSTNVVVNALPDFITGSSNVCEGATTALADITPAGTWSSSSSNATVNMATGVVSGVTAGTAEITYTIATGCIRTATINVDPLPADIAGVAQVCQGSTTALADVTPLGTWSTDNAAVATVDAFGIVTGGTTAGTANIIYTLPTGCAKSANVLVDPVPAAITGSPVVCEGSTNNLSSASTGGVWSSSAYAIAFVDVVTGDLTGVAAGTATVTYSLLTGCQTVADVTVNALPAAIVGTPAVCEGATTMLSSTTTGGTWTSGAAGTATVTSGAVTGVAAGLAPITYTIGTGCARFVDVLVNAAPTVYAVTGGGPYCAGTTGANVGISNSDASILYQLYNGAGSIGSAMPGVTGALNFGPQTVGTYSVLATDPTTGCTTGMAGVVSTSSTPTVAPGVSVAPAAGTTICAGTMTTFTATPVNGGSLPSYDWTVNGVPMASGSAAAYSYIPANGDVVSVVLNSSATCATPLIANDNVTMTVNPLEMPIATIALPAGVSTICDGSPVTITATPTFGGATPMYTWFKNGMPTGVVGPTYTYSAVSGDLVYCTMVSSFGCVATPAVNSNTLTMITAPVFVPVVSIAVSPGTVVPSGTSVTFSAVVTGAGPAPAYQWYVNGVIVPGATGINFTTSALAGSDSVSCKVMGSEPCGYESFNSVIMKIIQPTGVAHIAGSSDIALVPNPNKGDFAVKGSLASKNNEEVTIEITNVLGQTVYTGKTTAKGGAINERIRLNSSLANGMYMMNLHTESETQVIHFVLEQ